MPPEPPSFDLIVATVGRVDELGRFLDSLEAQTYRGFRVIVVDQNGDARLDSILGSTRLDVVRIASGRGLSRGRNAGLEHVSSDIVAFPDDDCVYPPGLLEGLAERFASHSALDGVTGRSEDGDGRSAASWRTDATVLNEDNLWNRAISFTIFLRRNVLESVGAFDERLGLGSPESWSSGEEIDYLIRAIRTGARIEYDPSLVVQHELGVDDARVAHRDGASVGYLLRKHRYPARTLARMFVRPVGGVVTSLVRGDSSRARFHAATLRGRVLGYRGARRAKSSV